MKKLLLTDFFKVETVESPIPEPGPGQAVVRIKYAGICGSDLHIFAGQHPTAGSIGKTQGALGRQRRLRRLLDQYVVAEVIGLELGQIAGYGDRVLHQVAGGLDPVDEQPAVVEPGGNGDGHLYLAAGLHLGILQVKTDIEGDELIGPVGQGGMDGVPVIALPVDRLYLQVDLGGVGPGGERLGRTDQLHLGIGVLQLYRQRPKGDI